MAVRTATPHQLGADRTIDVRGSAVALQVDADDLPTLGERGEVGAERLDRAEAAVQQDERAARSVDLVVELDAIHVCVRHRRFSFGPSINTSNNGWAKSTDL
jgi:hypothetical protein